MLDIVVLDPDTDTEFAYMADCPHCGDHSFQQRIKGTIAVGLLADEPQAHTIHVGHSVKDGVVRLHTKKGKKPYVFKKR